MMMMIVIEKRSSKWRVGRGEFLLTLGPAHRERTWSLKEKDQVEFGRHIKNISQIVSKYKLKEKDQVGFGRRVQLQFKYKYFLVFIFIYVHIYVDICFICKEINKEFLLCCCWYMVWLYMGRNLGKSPKMFWLSRCPGKDF